MRASLAVVRPIAEKDVDQIGAVRSAMGEAAAHLLHHDPFDLVGALRMSALEPVRRAACEFEDAGAAAYALRLAAQIEHPLHWPAHQLVERPGGPGLVGGID